MASEQFYPPFVPVQSLGTVCIYDYRVLVRMELVQFSLFILEESFAALIVDVGGVQVPQFCTVLVLGVLSSVGYCRIFIPALY